MCPQFWPKWTIDGIDEFHRPDCWSAKKGISLSQEVASNFKIQNWRKHKPNTQKKAKITCFMNGFGVTYGDLSATKLIVIWDSCTSTNNLSLKHITAGKKINPVTDCWLTSCASIKMTCEGTNSKPEREKIFDRTVLPANCWLFWLHLSLW